MNTKFKKGADTRRNTKGRPKGKPNRTTEQLRALLKTFVEGKIDELETIWRGLDAKEKINFLNMLLRHTLPPPINSIEQFSEHDLDVLIEKLKAKHNNNGYETAKSTENNKAGNRANRSS